MPQSKLSTQFIAMCGLCFWKIQSNSSIWLWSKLQKHFATNIRRAKVAFTLANCIFEFYVVVIIVYVSVYCMPVSSLRCSCTDINVCPFQWEFGNNEPRCLPAQNIVYSTCNTLDAASTQRCAADRIFAFEESSSQLLICLLLLLTTYKVLSFFQKRLEI